MSMTAMKVLDRVEELGMLEPAVIVELRRQVSESKFHVSAEAIVKLLVDKKHLTQFQAKKLVTEVTNEPPPQSSPGKALPTARSTDKPLPTIDEDDLLNLGDGPPVASAPAKPSQDEEVVDLEAALPPSQPIKATVKPLTPKASPRSSAVFKGHLPKATAADDDVVSLEPADVPAKPKKAKTQPAPFSAPPSPPALGPGLTPIAPPMSGLTPLSSPPHAPAGLSPLGAAEGLSGLSSLGGDLGFLGGPGLEVIAPPSQAPAASSPETKIKKKTARGWDSPLLLIGGGGLGVLVMAFVILYFALTRGSAQQILDEALENYRSGSYATAIQLYQKFVARYPDDPNVSSARVKIGLARIHQHYDGGKEMARALETVQTVLPELEQESSFDEARPELESILPTIADSFATDARASTDLQRMEKLVAQAHEAMRLVNNASYLPSSRRKNQASRIEAIEEKIRVAERTINQDKALASAMAELQAQVKKGDITAAYHVREKLLQSYPPLAKHADVIKNTLAISARERDLVTVSLETQSAASDDPHQANHPRVVLARRSGETIAAPPDAASYLIVEGAVYAIDVASGKLRWRRFVGYDTQILPVAFSGEPGGVLVADEHFHELLRLEAASGKVLWRQALKEAFATPVVDQNRVFVTLRSGRVVQIDAASGEITRAAQLPQETNVAAGLDPRQKVLYQPGSHSTIFVLAADESAGEPLSCQAAYYLGHRPGSIVVPPTPLVGYLFVFENVGVDSCLLHVLAPGDDKPLEPAREPFRLRGQVTVPPTVSGRRLAAVSNRGDTLVIDVDPNNADNPITVTAKMVGGLAQPTLGYSVLMGSRLLIADTRLADYEIVATRQALDRGKSSFDGDVFVAPLQVFDNALVHARRRQGAQSITVTGVDARNDKSWQLELAAPLAGVFAFPEQRRFAAITSDGDLFDVSMENFKEGLRDETTGSVRGSLAERYGPAIPLPDGKFLFPERGGRRWLHYDPTKSGGIQKVGVQIPDAITTTPVPFAGGLLAPTSAGTVWHLDPFTGAPLGEATPFQPETSPEAKIGWLPPLVIDDRQFVIVDKERKTMYLARREEKPQPFLAESRHLDLDYEPVAAALVGKTILVVARREQNDEVLSYAFPSFAPGNVLPLEGRVGPRGLQTVGDSVFCQTAAGKLLHIGETNEVAWQANLGGRTLAAAPLSNGADWLVIATDGNVSSLNGTTGERTIIAEAGEPLSGGVQLFGPRLAAGGNGTLHILPTKVDEK
jgi:outer membrane protein assembly factor BamB